MRRHSFTCASQTKLVMLERLSVSLVIIIKAEYLSGTDNLQPNIEMG